MPFTVIAAIRYRFPYFKWAENVEGNKNNRLQIIFFQQDEMSSNEKRNHFRFWNAAIRERVEVRDGQVPPALSTVFLDQLLPSQRLKSW